jgi:hypothetical protein
MSVPSASSKEELERVAREVPPVHVDHFDELTVEERLAETPEDRADRIEMIGEETAAGLTPTAKSEVTAGMRYLHCSRTIHQLIADRNRAVALYLAVVTLLWTASTALLNAKPDVELIISVDALKVWCLPFTFGCMAVLAVFASLLLTRTRAGLIYEVAKMNVLLGLPVGRVKRVNLFSIFFLMQAMVSLAGGFAAALLALHLLALTGLANPALAALATICGIAMTAALVALYVVTVKVVTSDEKLKNNT